NLYDNIWAPTGVTLRIGAVGILKYPQDVLGWSHKKARDRVSDHAPVWLTLDASAEPITLTSVSPGSARASSGPAAIIGNRSSKIYHWPGCPGYDKTSKRNRVEFRTRGEAEAAGYRAARNC